MGQQSTVVQRVGDERTCDNDDVSGDGNCDGLESSDDTQAMEKLR